MTGKRRTSVRPDADARACCGGQPLRVVDAPLGEDLEAELERPRVMLTRVQPDLWATDVLCELALVSARVHSLADASRLLDALEALAASDHTPAGREIAWARLIAAVLGEPIHWTSLLGLAVIVAGLVVTGTPQTAAAQPGEESTAA